MLFSLKHPLRFSSVNLWEWSQRPTCYSLNVKCPPRAHVSKHFVPSCQYCFGQQTHTTVVMTNGDNLTLFMFPSLFSGPLRCNNLHCKIYPQRTRFQAVLDCVSSNWELEPNSPLLGCFSRVFGHGNKKDIQCTCQVRLKIEQSRLWLGRLGFMKTLEHLDVLCNRMSSFWRLIHSCLLTNQHHPEMPCLALPSGKQTVLAEIHLH